MRVQKVLGVDVLRPPPPVAHVEIAISRARNSRRKIENSKNRASQNLVIRIVAAIAAVSCFAGESVDLEECAL